MIKFNSNLNNFITLGHDERLFMKKTTNLVCLEHANDQRRSHPVNFIPSNFATKSVRWTWSSWSQRKVTVITAFRNAQKWLEMVVRESLGDSSHDKTKVSNYFSKRSILELKCRWDNGLRLHEREISQQIESLPSLGRQGNGHC